MSALNCWLTIKQGTERGMQTYTTGQSQLFWSDLICVRIASARHLAHLSDLARHSLHYEFFCVRWPRTGAVIMFVASSSSSMMIIWRTMTGTTAELNLPSRTEYRSISCFAAPTCCKEYICCHVNIGRSVPRWISISEFI